MYICINFLFLRYRLKCTRTCLYLHMHLLLLFGIYCMSYVLCDVQILIQYNTKILNKINAIQGITVPEQKELPMCFMR